MTNVLFVDDEIQVLEGINRHISRAKPDWQVDFVTSAEHALQKIDIQEPDAIVTDILMTGLQGGEFISQLKTHHPSVNILVLSGHCEAEQQTKIESQGIPFLVKPTPANQLIQIIETQIINQKQENIFNIYNKEKQSLFNECVDIEYIILKLLKSVIAAGLLDAKELPDALISRLAEECAAVIAYDSDDSISPPPTGVKSDGETLIFYPVVDQDVGEFASNGWAEKV